MKVSLKEYFEEKFRSRDKELKLQAKEYKRRLKGLNGEAGRLREIQTQYLPREVFDRMMENMTKNLQIVSDWKIKQEGKSQLVQYVVPIVFTIINLILMYISYKK